MSLGNDFGWVALAVMLACESFTVMTNSKFISAQLSIVVLNSMREAHIAQLFQDSVPRSTLSFETKQMDFFLFSSLMVHAFNLVPLLTWNGTMSSSLRFWSSPFLITRIMTFLHSATTYNS